MATINAIKAGSWSDPTVWSSGTLPAVGDDVFSNGYTVTINQDITVASINGTGGGFVLAGTAVLNCHVNGGTTTALTTTAGKAATVNGNCTGSNTTAAKYGAYASGGRLTINGNCYGGSAGAAHGAYTTNNDNVCYINGAAIGGNGAGSFGAKSYGTTKNTVLIVSGNITSNSASNGVSATGVYGRAYVKTIVGSAANPFPADGNIYAIDGTAINITMLTDTGSVVLSSAGSSCDYPIASNVKAGVSYAGGTITGAYAANYPSAANVRYNISYGDGIIGTCRVPVASDVKLGVLVDAHAGTYVCPSMPTVEIIPPDCPKIALTNLCPSAVGATDSENLLNHQRGMMATITSIVDATAFIYGSVAVGSAAISCDMFGLFSHSLPATATVKLKLFSNAFAAGTPPSGAVVYDSGAILANNAGRFAAMSSWAISGDVKTFKSYTLEINGLSTGVNYVAGDLYMGKSIPLNIGFDTEASSFQQIESAEFATAQGGGLLAKSAPQRQRRQALVFRGLSKTVRNAIMQGEEDNPAGAWMVIAYPNSTDVRHPVEGTFIGKPQAAMTPVQSGAGYSITLDIYEI
ncbi:hypothetical protein [Thiothrix lacustris]|uniref:hypothetical protein n=1 Tax=Thiothrix lacustris TaxID=525917 RepID=UPI00048E784D|nr:hypothetical protein [Thiothrix lacustris]